MNIDGPGRRVMWSKLNPGLRDPAWRWCAARRRGLSGTTWQALKARFVFFPSMYVNIMCTASFRDNDGSVEQEKGGVLIWPVYDILEIYSLDDPTPGITPWSRRDILLIKRKKSKFGITSRTLLRASVWACDVRVILATASKAQAEGIGLCDIYHVGINGRGCNEVV